jgi:hypothetical protein
MTIHKCGFKYFVLVLAALAAFCSVLDGFGLVSASSTILSGFIVLCSSQLLSLHFGLFCIVLGWLQLIIVYWLSKKSRENMKVACSRDGATNHAKAFNYF